LWVDRCFTIAGAGTVVTGTLAGGTVSVGDRLDVAGDDKTVVVRGIQSRGEEHESVTATARVALNLRGVDRADLGRGAALVTSGRWLLVHRLDVYVANSDIARDVVVHIGSAAVPATTRHLGENALRLRLSRRVPLHYGDRLLLREPSSRAIVGVTVADLAPAPLRRRGDAAVVASALRVPARATDEVRRRGVVDVGWLTASGLAEEPDALRIADRWVDATRWELWRTGLHDLADQERGANGLPVEVVRDRLALPDSRLLAHLVGTEPAFEITNGHVRKRNPEVDLSGLDDLLRRLAGDPFAAPDGEEIRRLDRGALVRGVRAGCLLQLGPGMYVAADAPDLAITRLGGLPQPFTVSAATRALGSTRRVVVPLLEHLDAARKTQRLPDGTRLLVGTGG
jgi:selenocysteine-specific elongation factor